jgi:hypothetical protein
MSRKKIKRIINKVFPHDQEPKANEAAHHEAKVAFDNAAYIDAAHALLNHAYSRRTCVLLLALERGRIWARTVPFPLPASLSFLFRD